jgi:hypothetical protein
MWLGANWVKEANAEWLQRGELTLKLGEAVEDFSIRLNTTVGELHVLSDVVSDKEVIKRMLHAVPERFEQVAIFMETLLDLDSLCIEEAIGHLRAVQQRKKPPPAKENSGRLLLTEEECLVRMKTPMGLVLVLVHALAPGTKVVEIARLARVVLEKERARWAATIPVATVVRNATEPMSAGKRNVTRKHRRMSRSVKRVIKV